MRNLLILLIFLATPVYCIAASQIIDQKTNTPVSNAKIYILIHFLFPV